MIKNDWTKGEKRLKLAILIIFEKL